MSGSALLAILIEVNAPLGIFIATSHHADKAGVFASQDGKVLKAYAIGRKWGLYEAELRRVIYACAKQQLHSEA